MAHEREVQLSYGIGQAQPVDLDVETFGTGRLPDKESNGACSPPTARWAATTLRCRGRMIGWPRR